MWKEIQPYSEKTLIWRDPTVWEPPGYGCGCCCPCDFGPRDRFYVEPQLAMEDATLRNVDAGFNDADALV